MIPFAVGMIVGLLAGALLTWLLLAGRRKAAATELQALQQQMRDAFASLAAAALDANSKRLAESTAAALDGKKELIDQSVKGINERLNDLGRYFKTVENDRKNEFGRLSESISQLQQTSGELHKVLASTQRRGAWGERMADDILRLVGFIQDVNYTKQDTRFAAGDRERPDFTFLLPNDLAVNMDVKFPLENYRAYLDAEADAARDFALAQLVRDVRGHIRAVACRGYVDTRCGTVDYVMVFIPSEQIYSLVLNADADLIDDALGLKVVLASPLTLYAMLAVIRQAAEHANLMKTAGEVLDLLAAFNRQWQNYKEEQDKLGAQLDTVNRTYERMRTTRTNVLERPLEKIEDLRAQQAESSRIMNVE
jgi:DNA recombination protein RmuC